MNANGSGKTKIAGNASLTSSPVFSPDGSEIAFARDLGVGNGGLEIFVMDADGSNQTSVSDHAGSDEMPSFSPDGSKIAFASDRDGAPNVSDIYVMNAEGSDQTRLTDHPMVDNRPAFSPNGEKLAFMSTRGANQLQIYVMKAEDGSNETDISNSGESDFGPNWGPRVTVRPPVPLPVS